MCMHLYMLEDCITPRHPVEQEKEAVLDQIVVNNVTFPRVAGKFDGELILAVGGQG